ncbi:B-cell receptor CD22-like protein [Lates japonicus]|uniref:B-cell receptor CD22-like protein n=1 Tax=Lates japonicus TaxID=270547 RepID=A0AAD3N098_LATJO|nr:B-cell receptor CD22-like protein [Lates japonicus]
MTNIIRLTLVVLMLIPLLLLILWTRRKKTRLSSTTEPNDYEETVEMDSPPVYENVSDLKAVTAAQTPRAAGRCVVQGQDDWGVTYTSTEICAFKGSTVDIHCTYTYPPRIKGHDTTVERTFWFTKEQNNEPVDLRTDSDYTGRVQYHCGENSCTLTITDLRESDSAEYKFRFITNQPGGRFTGSPGVTVFVSDLQVRRSSEQVELRCRSSYAPVLPSVSVSPSGQIVEGSFSTRPVAACQPSS